MSDFIAQSPEQLSFPVWINSPSSFSAIPLQPIMMNNRVYLEYHILGLMGYSRGFVELSTTIRIDCTTDGDTAALHTAEFSGLK